MEKDPNKLYLIIAWLSLIGVALALMVSNYLITKIEIISVINSIGTELVSALLIFIILFYFTRKKIINENEIPFSEVLTRETNVIYNHMSNLESKIDQILQRKEQNAWEDYYNILVSLRGTWLEFIPKRELQNCEISIAHFNLDNHDKHSFYGKNYFTNTGDTNYSWETIKVLPPTRHDDETIYIYYIYRRSDNEEFENKYGFGKLVAKRDNDSKNGYSFVNGFFFNEATGDEGYFLMKTLRIETIEKFLDIEIKGKENDKTVLKNLFQALKKSNVYSKWR